MSSDAFAAEIAWRLRTAYGGGDVIPLHEPELDERSAQAVADCVRSGWVSSSGPEVAAFEEALARYTGIRRVVAVANGTIALQLALVVADVRPGDEVVVPALSFIATSNAVWHTGAVPHFADIARTTLGLDPAALEDHLARIAEPGERGAINRSTGRTIRAVIPMHAFGHPVDLPALAELCAQHGLALIEDAAESLGSTMNGRHTGRWGAVSALSFNGNKIITTGGGGAVITEHDSLADRAKHLSTTAKRPHPWRFEHDAVGYNFRMPNLNAALGLAQMQRLPTLVAAKRRLANGYFSLLAGLAEARMFHEPAGAQSNYWLNVLLLDKPDGARRDAVLAATHALGIRTRPAWELLTDQAPNRGCPAMPVPVAREMADRIVTLPSSARLAERGFFKDT